MHWAHRVAGVFPDGQLYVNLRGFDATRAPMVRTDGLRGFIDALTVPSQPVPATVDAQVGRYRTLLAGRRMLILLDNASDAEQVHPLLPGSPGCLVLVTSRDHLADLVAAVGAYPLDLAEPSTMEAHELLVSRLGLERIAAEPDAVDEIVTRCARLPLALAIRGVAPAQVRRQLAELVSSHLIAEPVPGRYTLPDLLRPYACELAEVVDPEHERRAAQRRLLDQWPHIEGSGLPPEHPTAAQPSSARSVARV